jgi:GNAT superfamily N-acetyltransferase
MTSTTAATDLGIRKAGPEDRDAVGATIAAGFFDDPVTVWLLPDVDRRREVIQPMFAIYADAYLRHDEVYLTADGNGTAVWLPPGKRLLTPEQEEAFGAAMADLLGSHLDRALQLEETFAKHHPTEPLWYLNFLSTVPAFQGRGMGSAFLRQTLARADCDGVPAYHEATTPRNRALYERHGYVNQGEFRLPDDGPPLWRMWREPR